MQTVTVPVTIFREIFKILVERLEYCNKLKNKQFGKNLLNSYGSYQCILKI